MKIPDGYVFKNGRFEYIDKEEPVEMNMNNKCYIVSYCVDDPDDWDMIHNGILGIFSSREKAEEAIEKESKRLNLNHGLFRDFNFKDDLFEYSFSIEKYNLDEASCVVTPKDLYESAYLDK